MAFPTSPTNGQTYTVNGIVYVYSSAKTAWQVQSSGSATVPTTVGTNLSITGNFAASGTLAVTGNANVGNIGTTTAIATTANLTTINSPLIQNGNSNVSIAANGNVSIGAIGTANVLAISNTAATITGNLTVNGTLNVQVIAVFNNVSFASSVVTGSFTLNRRSTILMLAGSSSYLGSAANMTMTLSIDGVGTIATMTQFTNEVSSHKAFPVIVGTTTLNAGTYTGRLTAANLTDTNDKGSLAVIAIPSA